MTTLEEGDGGDRGGQTRGLSHFSPKTILATVQEVEVLAVMSWEGPGLALRSDHTVMPTNGSITLSQVPGGQVSEEVESVPI